MHRKRFASSMLGQFVVAGSVAAALLGLPAPAFATPILAPELASFAVLGAESVTNTGPTKLAGNLGVSNNSSPTGITGFKNTLLNDGPGTFTGSHVLADQGNAFAIMADNELCCTLTSAITTLNLMGPGTVLPFGDLSQDGSPVGTLTPGVYTVPFAISNLTGSLTLNGLGNSNAQWVFLFPVSSFITSPGSSVNMINVGSGSNVGVFWNVGSTATLDTTTTIVGNILASTSIHINNGVTINCGRALAHTGDVTMINDTITSIGCDSNGGGGPAVPEPTTAILLASGLAGVAAWRKRQNRVRPL